MKIKFLASVLLFFFGLINSPEAQKKATQNGYKGNEYEALNARLCKGWNTWDTWSVLCYAILPEGFAINLQLLHHQSGDTLKEALIGREDFGAKEHVIPGPHAYDGSYTELIVEWHKMRVKVQSASKNEQLFLLISPISNLPDDSIIVSSKMLWSKKGDITVNYGTIKANTPSNTIKITIVGGQYTSKGDYLKVSLSEVVALSSDPSKSTNDVKKIINEARAKLIAERSKYGDASESFNAIQTALSWNVIYEPVKNRVITPVSRLWNVGWKGWTLFEWDTYFAAYMLSMDNKELAYANAIAMTKEITASGFIPNFGSSVSTSEDRSEPPVGALVIKRFIKNTKKNGS